MNNSPEVKEQNKSAVKSAGKAEGKLAVVLVRGLVRTHRDIRKTCELLHLHYRLNCVIVPNNQYFRGMLRKIKDVVTYGPVTADTEKALAKRKKRDHYTLHPPRGGFERKGIKMSWKKGGVLGERDEMDSLLAKMV